MAENKFSGYFDYYISRVSSSDLIELLSQQEEAFKSYLENIPTEKLEFAYESGKWTVKEVVFHIIETEIIMLYRAIRISRGDKTMLPGYDQNMMVEKARVAEMTWNDLKQLFSSTRQNTLFYFKHMTSDELEATGNFSDLTLNVEGIGYLLGGHLDHHLEVLKEKYHLNH